MSTTHGSGLIVILILVEYIMERYRAACLTLDEQTVRWYQCIFEFVGVITWCRMHYGMIAIVLHAHHVLFRYTTMATTHGSAPN